MKEHKEPAVVVDIAINLMGSVSALANALQVDRRTITRWRKDKDKLSGAALVAVLQLIKHPEEFRQYKREG